MAAAPIRRLSQSTTRLLGSAVIVVTPESVIKELLDNSIDAGATTVDISISRDTIGKILVRDDGHGIDAQDFQYLGTRSCTSKLRDMEELRRKGGSTLGFRGDGLASINAFGRVTVTTRTASAPVATTFNLRSGEGDIQDQKAAAADVGTVIQVTDLFQAFPVRKLQAEKNRQKTLSNVIALLHSYAMARPLLRLRYNVIGDPRSFWSMAPNPGNDSLRECVLQIIGADVAAQCHSTSWTEEQFEFKAFLPRPDCDWSLVGRKKHYISIDGRPQTSSRGTMKKIVTCFKTTLKEVKMHQNSNNSAEDPFLRLEIRCNPEQYDVNISPAKDEVLFRDEKCLLDAFEMFLRRIYRLDETPESDFASNLEKSNANIGWPNQKPQAAIVESTSDARQDTSPIEVTVRSQTKLDMLRTRTISSETGITMQLPPGTHSSMLAIIRAPSPPSPPSNDLNPWTIAKRNRLAEVQPEAEVFISSTELPNESLRVDSTVPESQGVVTLGSFLPQPGTSDLYDLSEHRVEERFSSPIGEPVSQKKKRTVTASNELRLSARLAGTEPIESESISGRGTANGIPISPFKFNPNPPFQRPQRRAEMRTAADAFRTFRSSPVGYDVDDENIIDEALVARYLSLAHRTNERPPNTAPRVSEEHPDEPRPTAGSHKSSRRKQRQQRSPQPTAPKQRRQGSLQPIRLQTPPPSSGFPSLPRSIQKTEARRRKSEFLPLTTRLAGGDTCQLIAVVAVDSLPLGPLAWRLANCDSYINNGEIGFHFPRRDIHPEVDSKVRSLLSRQMHMS